MMHIRGFEREKNLDKEAYYSDGYFDKYQLFSLSEQISLLYEYCDHTSEILEIGKGNGFVSDYFKNANFNFKTFDINEELEPDIVGNIIELEKSVTYTPDIILCCEVLEHMEFKYFENVLEQMRNVTNQYVIITLPNFQKSFGVNFQVRLPKHSVFSLPVFFHTSLGKSICDEHYWEINYTEETSKKNIERILSTHYTIEDKGYFHTNPYHYFYVLKKM